MPAAMNSQDPSNAWSDDQWRGFLDQEVLPKIASARRLLIVPPDHTRLKSMAGAIAAHLWRQLHTQMHVDLMPALGTHKPMGEADCRRMFGEEIPTAHIIPHDHRRDTIELGTIPEDEVRGLSGGRWGEPAVVAVNHRALRDYDLILSVGQVVPHEVVGMANYTKNLVIGLGGPDLIDKSHFLGALVGIERIMGETDTPVRRLLNTAFDRFVRPRAEVLFLYTVLESRPEGAALRGMFLGDDAATFSAAASLSQCVNIKRLADPLRRCVVYLDPHEYSSTWLGNKAIYRTRRAMADGGELVVLAPGIKHFGEQAVADELIRRYGYRGTPATLAAVAEDSRLAANLSAAAHLIHGSTEGRFSVTYCPSTALSRDDMQQVGFSHRSWPQARDQYWREELTEGFHLDADGDSFYFIRDPGQGLWVA